MAEKTKLRSEISLQRGKKESPEIEKLKTIKIKVIGIGGGAGNIVSEIASRLKKASFFSADTDSQALMKPPKGVGLFQFGQNITFGLGTGMKPELGETAAKEDRERIKKILKGADLCIFLATLGGGVGSGAAPIFAEISKNLGNLNYGIFTLPFGFEGKKRMEIAKNSLGKLRQNLNAFSLIENERIFQIIERRTPLKFALSQINKILAEALGGLIEIIYQPGLINIDFADIRTIFRGGGKLAYLNAIEAGGENRTKEAIGNVLNSPLYSYNIQGAKGILFDIAGDKNLALVEVGEISKSIFELGERGAKIIFGVSENKGRKGKIRVTLLATGCRSKIFPEEISQKKYSKKAPPSLKLRRARPKKKIQKVKVEEQKTEPGVENTPQLRKNALQLKKEAEEAERELVEKEKFWETPALLRQKNQNAGNN
jgi:cell division protein FtsZ